MRLYKREQYLKKLRPFYDSDIIKVITGIRRCGKSCLMQSVIRELRELGVPEENIVDINLDKRGFKSIKTPAQLEATIDDRVKGSGLKYLFIDEIQNVRGYEEVVNAFREEGDFSIFITGSNSYLLSGELMTKLTGRYIEFEMFPLNFHEFLEMKRFERREPLASKQEEFETYLRYGGFPKTLEFIDDQAKLDYVESVIGQIMDKDVRQRAKIRNRDAFNRVATYVINNFGSTTSITSITQYLDNTLGLATKRSTVSRYVEILESAEILNKCQRFDLKSKQSLGAQEKYYLSDTSIYFARNTDSRINFGPVLENVLYTYLRSKGYMVSVGRIGKLECDFIVRKHDEYAYVQVAMTIADPATEEREYKVFERIRDGYPRYLLTLDPLQQKRDGVMHLNLIDFMASDGDLL